jgi:hypothetical protein
MFQMNQNTAGRLRRYSALAAALGASAGVSSAQIIYTDISDVTLYAASNPGDLHFLDLNNDGSFDYLFRARTNGGDKFIGMVMYPYYTNHLNAIAGEVEMDGIDILGYPSLMEFNDLIDDGLSFFQLSDLINVNNIFQVPAMYSENGGDAIGEWQEGVTDGFVAVKISPDGTNFHFGWIRCDVASDGSSITIKDFAYNSEPDSTIFAGQGVPTGLEPETASEKIKVISQGKLVLVIIEGNPVPGTEIILSNPLGQVLRSVSNPKKETRITLERCESEMILVTVIQKNEVVTRKVYLH